MSEIKQISTGKAEVLAIKTTVTPKNPHFNTVGNKMFLTYFTRNSYGWDQHNAEIPPSIYKILGLSNALTEEQCRELITPEIVAELDNGHGVQEYFGFIDFTDEDNAFDTAKESLNSLMRVNECFTVNPYAGIFTPRLPHQDAGDLGQIIGDVIYNDMKELFMQAEANTGSWLILKRL
jgi:hypothetical protein